MSGAATSGVVSDVDEGATCVVGGDVLSEVGLGAIVGAVVGADGVVGGEVDGGAVTAAVVGVVELVEGDVTASAAAGTTIAWALAVVSAGTGSGSTTVSDVVVSEVIVVVGSTAAAS